MCASQSLLALQHLLYCAYSTIVLNIDIGIRAVQRRFYIVDVCVRASINGQAPHSLLWSVLRSLGVPYLAQRPAES